ncbi:glutamate--cysteine ligase regulatory subunit-like isoform X2 [Heterodontus francisci]|uniref:glutamate--cysteine ligase regulatory subunit-like isoform X2 n=1 Tax=Heterodontus francisci TaxID=7792 RepID=UPI00355C598D
MSDLKSWMFDLNMTKTISVSTGNVVKWCASMKTCPVSTDQEVLYCIKAALVEWASRFQPDQAEVNGLPQHLVCNLVQDTERIGPNEREDIRISVKLFICRFDTAIVKEAVTRACVDLGVTQLDSVILAVAPLPGGQHPTLEDLKPYWKELEILVQDQKIASIGVSDLDQKMLEALCQHAQISFRWDLSRKPSVPVCRTLMPMSGHHSGSFDTQQSLSTEESSSRKVTCSMQ